MQVDSAKLTKLTDVEREKLRKRGGCFFCRKDGHMARECPEKKKAKQTTATTQNPPAKACAVEIQEDEPPPKYKALVTDVHATIRAMSKEKRKKLLEKLIEEGSDDEEPAEKDF